MEKENNNNNSRSYKPEYEMLLKKYDNFVKVSNNTNSALEKENTELRIGSALSKLSDNKKTLYAPHLKNLKPDEYAAKIKELDAITPDVKESDEEAGEDAVVSDDTKEKSNEKSIEEKYSPPGVKSFSEITED